MRKRIQEIIQESITQREGEMIVDGVKVKVRTKMPPTQKANDEIQRYSDASVLSEYLESGFGARAWGVSLVPRDTWRDTDT